MEDAPAPSGPSPRGEKPTLRTISRLSGLAVTTVSRALSDAPDISAKTKEKVRRIANEIGYVPNRAGVRLRTGRTNVISIVLGTEHEGLNATIQLISAVAAGLRGTRFHLNMTPAFPDEDPLTPIRYIVETRSADAVIINQTQPRDPRVRYLLDRGFPFVTHGRTDWADDHAWYDFDNIAFGQRAVGQLAARGRRAGLLLAPPPAQFYAREMIAGALGAAQAQGLALVQPDTLTSDSPHAEVSEGIAAHLRAHPETDGLIVASPNAAMASALAIEATGRTIGEDFDIIAKETVPFLSLFRPGITTISEDIETAGHFLARAAVEAALPGPNHPMRKLEAIDQG